MAERLAPWHADEIPGLRLAIKRKAVEEGAIKSPELLEQLKIEYGFA